MIIADRDVKSKVGGLDVCKEKEGNATRDKDMEKGGEGDKEMNKPEKSRIESHEKTRIASEEPGTPVQSPMQSPKVKADDICKEDPESSESKQERYKCQCEIM
jgi:hypothetical protein